MSHGFPRSVRLRRSADFQRVQRRGQSATTEHLVVRWLGNDLEGARFGLAVSRKVGNAVVRNRVKRWLREAIRHHRPGLTGVDVVFIARAGASDAGFLALSTQVASALDRIRRAA